MLSDEAAKDEVERIREQVKAGANGQRPVTLERITYDVLKKGTVYRVFEGLEYELSPGVIGTMKRPYVNIVKKVDTIRAAMMRKQLGKAERVDSEGDDKLTMDEVVSSFDPESEEYVIGGLLKMVSLILAGLPDGWEEAEELSTDFLQAVKNDFLSLR